MTLISGSPTAATFRLGAASCEATTAGINVIARQAAPQSADNAGKAGNCTARRLKRPHKPAKRDGAGVRMALPPSILRNASRRLAKLSHRIDDGRPNPAGAFFDAARRLRYWNALSDDVRRSRASRCRTLHRMSIRLHRGDLPDPSRYTGAVAIDTETMGLQLGRDRLCLVQLSPGDGSADIVQIAPHAGQAPNLVRLLADPQLLKIFHFGRFDLAALCRTFGVMPEPVYCTKIASRLARTYTDKHGLKDLVREVLGHDLSKQQQSSDWGAPDLTDAQISYAAADVIYLHALRERLDRMLAREGRDGIAAACFRFLPDRVRLDLAGYAAEDIFAHS
jgi:ribonuclease D